ncbi:MAG: HlyD family efflux transporter periplasmic adaptor subunit [Rhodobacteraceae bacterium]|nr:HlyD family efflux transporter periplasmic adaptor subunit [Paracoccaceae bacterium]
MSLKPRTIGLAGVGAAVLLGLAYTSFQTDPVPVDLAEVTRGPMQVTIDADGKTRIREIFEVAAPFTGTAMRSPVAVGDPVVAGETIVAIVEPTAPGLLDTRSRVQAEAATHEAEAALNVAQTELRKATDDAAYALNQHERTKKLVERAVAAFTQLEATALQLNAADAGVAAAQARVAMAEGTLERARAALIEPNGSGEVGQSCCVQLLAPADGLVLSIAMISERPVTAGANLLRIGDPADLELTVDLLSSDAVRIAPNANAKVKRWGGNTPLAARLKRIEPTAHTKISALGIEEQRVDAVFALTTPVEERPGLGAGFSVFLRIIEWQADDALRLPVSALFKNDTGWAVYVAQDGIAAMRAVEIGQRNNQVAEVLSGLSVGEQVVLHPSDRMLPGIEIIDRREL